MKEREIRRRGLNSDRGGKIRMMRRNRGNG